ncbi:hypothetical protein [Microbacterium candidum]|uniref:DUF3185 domain-containing protein n=1 Tax=Microbacterium candidum TaxID=3041922 RepID=A0ABT7MWN9_9MICO|nr:hypothetical protein [Microbacterium sp. ASV49]MDL9978857.1 hypothetical protein [Microbacterium sp. ASV49]
MKNPPLAIATVVAVVGLVVGVVLLGVSLAGATRTYNIETMQMEGGIPVWAALIPLAIGVIAGMGALILWGMQRAQPSA